MNKKAIIAIVVVAVVLLGAVAWALGRPANESTTGTNNTPTSETSQGSNASPSSDANGTETPSSSGQAAVTIAYTNSGFDKPSYTVKTGDTIKIQNNSDAAMSFNSDDHPTHTKQSELNVGEIEPGQSKTFTIDKTGTWGFHDHFNSAHTGSIIVQ